MCHIPVFCWITATVLEQMLKGSDKKIPSSLTELYTRFLLIQTSEKKKKYHGTTETDPQNLSEKDVQLILKLGKLAFDNLQKRNIVFSKKHLQKYGINITEASLRSGMFTEILKQEDPIFSEKMYSFVHLSFQEYLAALYVLHTFAHKGENLMQTKEKQHWVVHRWDCDCDDSKVEMVPQLEVSLHDLQKCAIHKALKSSSGHLDLFLRFFLGISLESNQMLLRSFSMNVEGWQKSILQTVQYLKWKLREDVYAPSAEQCVNLFHCLLELDDHSVAEEIQSFLTSDRKAEGDLTAAQCSTLAYIILMSEEVLEELDVNKFNTSNEGRRRLIPALRNCKKALLVNMDISEWNLSSLISAVVSPNSQLRDLDLSHIQQLERRQKLAFVSDDSAAQLLEKPEETLGDRLLRAIGSSPVQLHTLKLKDCRLCDDSCSILASTLRSDNSRLKELDLSYNFLTDTGVQEIYQSLQYSVLEILRFNGSCISGVSCETLRYILPDSQLKELDLGSSPIGDDGLKEICIALQMKPMLTSLGLRDCSLTAGSCEVLASALSSESLALRELDLSNNDLEDSGLKLLSTGLQSPHCKLEILRLSGCVISEKGCSALASALTSNPSHLKELDLSYNHPGESGKRLLSAKLEDPHCRLETLDFKHGGEHRMKPGLKKYACDVQKFLLTEWKARQRKRFPENFSGLSESRFYWQVELKGFVEIGVNYQDDWNLNKWLLYCNAKDEHHSNRNTASVDFRDGPNQLGVYLDYPAGLLSFYKISSDKITHVHSFHHRFQKPLYPVFVPVYRWSDECSVKIQTL